VFRWQEERRLTESLTLHYKRVMYVVGLAHDDPFPGCIARVSQAAITENKLLGAALADIQRRQQERDAHTLANTWLTLRDEDLLRKAMGEAGLPTRRKVGRPTIREKALERMAAEGSSGGGTLVEDIVAHAVHRLGGRSVATANRRAE